MTYVSTTDEASGKGYVVRRPRDSDAIGEALRSAYCPNRGLPHDFSRVLDQLDRR